MAPIEKVRVIAGTRITVCSYYRLLTEIDKDTLEKFWAMSEPGSPAEHCFLRITESEFFYEKPDDIERMMGWYPNVCTNRFKISLLKFGLPSFTRYPKMNSEVVQPTVSDSQP